MSVNSLVNAADNGAPFLEFEQNEGVNYEATIHAQPEHAGVAEWRYRDPSDPTAQFSDWGTDEIRGFVESRLYQVEFRTIPNDGYRFLRVDRESDHSEGSGPIGTLNFTYTFRFVPLPRIAAVSASPIYEGGTSRLFVEAENPSPLDLGVFYYQWFEGESGDTSKPLAGRLQSAQFLLKNVAQPINVWCRVDNTYGTVDSETLSVKVKPLGVQKVEYFIDHDPGVDKGIQVEVSSAAEWTDVEWAVEVESLALGAHVLGVRTVDSLGNWSRTSKMLFQRVGEPAHRVTAVEYFIDEDPGPGNAFSLDWQGDLETSDASWDLSVENLGPGMHTLGIRARDEEGHYSRTSTMSFAAIGAPRLSGYSFELLRGQESLLSGSADSELGNDAGEDEFLIDLTSVSATGDLELVLTPFLDSGAQSFSASETFELIDDPIREDISGRVAFASTTFPAWVIVSVNGAELGRESIDQEGQFRIADLEIVEGMVLRVIQDGNGNGLPDIEETTAELDLQPAELLFRGTDLFVETNPVPPPVISLEIAHRLLPVEVVADERFEVLVLVDAAPALSAFSIEEQIPPGGKVMEVMDGGVHDEAGGRILWGPFSGDASLQLRYILSLNAGEDGSAEFDGRIVVEGESASIGGDSSVIVVKRPPPVPLPPRPTCLSSGGLISFVNPRGPVLDVDGTPATSIVMGQLYVGATINQLEPICEPIPVLTLGVFNGGETAVPETAGGEAVFVQLRAWKGAPDFESATIRGQSEVLTLTLKTPGELVPAPSLGIGSFRLAEALPEARFVPPVLEGGTFILRWTGAGRLQESVSLDGPYSDSPNQSNPQEVLVTEATNRFYRIVQE